jgi:alginate O-acetyltransferase complex protein AlgI
MNLLLIALVACIPLILLSWLLPEKWQMFPVAIATVVFLGYVSPVSLVILTVSSLITYYVLQSNTSQPTATLVIVIQVSCVLLIFKLQTILHYNITENALLPLGLSYYSFRQIHYAIEVYKKKMPTHSIIDFLNYLFFLPTLLVGPINLFQPFLKDLRKRRWDNLLFSQGLERVLYGLVKIVVIGNYLLTLKLNLFCNSIAANHVWLSTYLQVFKFTANAYFQFAGFSDVAIGLSMLFGFRIVENFNFPFLAKNIADFWKRWHISLSSWCREYVFYPFLGITRNAAISILISMIVLGIWHEISIRYILWGLLHAVAINIWYKYEATSWHKKLNLYPLLQNAIGVVVTLNFVMISFVMVSEPSLNDSFKVLQTLFFLK